MSPTLNISSANMKSFNDCINTPIQLIVKTSQTSDQINVTNAKHCWLIAFATAMLMTFNVLRHAIVTLLIAKVTVNREMVHQINNLLRPVLFKMIKK